MEATLTAASPKPYSDVAGLFQASKKITVIRLRWLIIIITSYLLVFPHDPWLPPSVDYTIIFLYILTNFVFYFVDEELFESSYFYTPLVVFDTVFITASLVLSGQVGTDFYLAYFLIVILCTIWQDFRGLISVAALATVLYGYFLLVTTPIPDPSIYLRIPFLFIISLFYGYFAQVVRVEKALKEEAEQEAQDMAMIQTLSQSLPSSLDYQQIIATLGDKINAVVHSDWFYVFITDEGGHASRGLVFGGELHGGSEPREVDLREYSCVQECLRTRQPVMQRNVRPSFPSAGVKEEPRDLSFPFCIAVPIVFRGEALGAFLLGFRDSDHNLTSRETQFCQIVAFATAIALSNARKYEELQIEAKRRQIVADELADANRLKIEYLANTSHELRTPIATIMGYGNLMLDGACGGLTEEQKKVIERLLDNTRGLLALVDQILEYSKIEKGERGLYLKRGMVGNFLKELRGEIAPLEANKPFRVEYHIGDGIPPIVTDWGKLKSILTNILSNAIKFTDEGGVRLSVVNGSGGKEVSFIVSDTGIGIPRDQIPVIFDKFRQLDGSTKRRYQGTGLGLTITRNLAELLGGRIEVESELGKGSTFRVTIPVSIS